MKRAQSKKSKNEKQIPLSAEAKELLKAYHEEMKEEMGRHTGILSEEFQSRLSAVAEQVGGVQETMEIIKSDISFLKEGMRIKVDYEEFGALEQRVPAFGNESAAVAANW